MIDRSAAEGNPSSRILMAILFADGAKGLKYGCPEATKYLSEDASSFPYFRVFLILNRDKSTVGKLRSSEGFIALHFSSICSFLLTITRLHLSICYI